METINPTVERASESPVLLPLAALYPNCFNEADPRPLKIGLHKDLAERGHKPAEVRTALAWYCKQKRYRHCMIEEGTARIDLDGQPAGVVSAKEAEFARRTLLTPAQRKAQRQETQAGGPLPSPNTPLPEEYLVPGRLDLTVKFSDLPKPLAVQGGMKIGIQTGEGIVTTVLTLKMWKKLEQTVATYPVWVAALSGSLDQLTGGEIALKNPAVQVFEKKAKPIANPPAGTAATDAVAASPAPLAPTPASGAVNTSRPADMRAPVSPPAEGKSPARGTIKANPAMAYAKLSLKPNTGKRG